MSQKSPKKTKGSLGEERTEFASERSAEAAERTLMAAVRTAVAMIGFGFTIARFFEYMGKLDAVQISQGDLIQGPHHLGLVLLAGGTLSIALGLLEYVGYMRRLPAQPDRNK